MDVLDVFDDFGGAWAVGLELPTQPSNHGKVGIGVAPALGCGHAVSVGRGRVPGALRDARREHPGPRVVRGGGEQSARVLAGVPQGGAVVLGPTQCPPQRGFRAGRFEPPRRRGQHRRDVGHVGAGIGDQSGEAFGRLRPQRPRKPGREVSALGRRLAEAEGVLAALADNGLVRGEDDFKVMMMCEVPSNVILADQFLDHFDGFSIGSNDLTQLTLGLDRDSGLVAAGFDESTPYYAMEYGVKFRGFCKPL